MTEDLTNVIRALGSNTADERFTATQRLVERGESALPALIDVFNREDEPLTVKAAIIPILGHIGDEKTMELLTHFITLGWQNPERIDLSILERTPLALGMLVQSRLLNHDVRFQDRYIDEAVAALLKSLGVKTQQYREGKLPNGRDLTRAINENIAYRLNVITALRMIGDVDAIVDALGYFLIPPVRLEEMAFLIAVVEALGWIGATPISKVTYDEEKTKQSEFLRISHNKDRAIGILKQIIYKDVGAYEVVRRTARNALKLITGQTD
jgi:hypothetical protein